MICFKIKICNLVTYFVSTYLHIYTVMYASLESDNLFYLCWIHCFFLWVCGKVFLNHSIELIYFLLTKSSAHWVTSTYLTQMNSCICLYWNKEIIKHKNWILNHILLWQQLQYFQVQIGCKLFQRIFRVWVKPISCRVGLQHSSLFLNSIYLKVYTN